MQLYTMDFPAGYVTRWDGFGPVEFPKDEHCIGNRLPEVLELVVKGRWLLEATKKQIDGYRVTNAISRLGIVPDHIVDTFIPAVKKPKKRKVEVIDDDE